MDESPDLARLPVRHRGSVPPAGARARTSRASGCCRCRSGSAACRRTPTRRSRPPTRAFRPSRCRPANPTQVSYGQYRKLLATCRAQADRRAAYEALYDTYTASLNTYAAIYNGVMQGDWFEARSRGYETTLDAALFGNAIPTSVVENLIRETKNGVAPFRRYHQLRKRVLGLADYHVFDAFVPLVDFDEHYQYDEVLDWIVEAVAPLGAGVPGARARGVRRPLDRRLREPGQAQRRLFGAGLRRQSVHADELQRHARRGVHAGARARPLDAHAAVARDAAVRLCRLHHLRRRGAVDARTRRCCSS